MIKRRVVSGAREQVAAEAESGLVPHARAPPHSAERSLQRQKVRVAAAAVALDHEHWQRAVDGAGTQIVNRVFAPAAVV